MSADPVREHFDLAIVVQPADIDVLGHVNNVVYLRWVQEVAIAHWEAATTAEQRAEVVWVVARHEIDYKRPALPGDSVVARTWVGKASRHTFERHTEILRAGEEQALVRARTVWVPIDPASGRVTLVSDGIRRRFSVTPDAP